MSKIHSLILSLFMSLSVFADDLGPLALLSDNMAPGGKSSLYSKTTPVLRTGATYSFVTEGEFATCKGSVKSATDNGGVKVLFDGAEWWKSQTYGDWDGGSWVTVVVDLKKPYLIGKVDVRALREAMRDTKQAYILFSMDGKAFMQHGIAESAVPVAPGKGGFVEHQAVFEKPVLSRFVEVRIQKARHQQQISEIAVWGWDLDGDVVTKPDTKSTAKPTFKYITASEKPTVEFEIEPIQDGSAYLSWAHFAKKTKGVSAWRVYYSDKAFSRADEEGVTFYKQYSGKLSAAAIYPFEPGSTVYFGMTGVYAEGEDPAVESIPLQFKTPFERNTFGDMLAINHYVGGGAPSRGKSWSEVGLDMLGETPFRESRWWFMFPETVNQFLDRKIGMITWPMLSGDAIKNNVKNANNLGLYSFTKGNEPELKGTKPEAYLESLKQEFAEAKQMSKWNTIGAPTCNIWPTALEWLEGFYKAGAKDYFDVLDLHTYTTPPEDLFGRIETVRGIMAKYGDAKKPIISTEFGYADTPEGPEGVTPLMKAQYLVRGLIIHYVLDFKRVYVYSFIDVGTDPHYNEHHFGLLDYDLQKKPAYYAVCNLGTLLKNCTLTGTIPGAEAPSYGYQFEDKKAGAQVAVIWNGADEQLGTFSTSASRVEIIDLMGSSRHILLDSSKRFSLPFGASPVFIRSDAPVTLQSAKVLEKKALAASTESTISFNLSAPNAIVSDDSKTSTLHFSLVNNSDQAVNGSLTIRSLEDAVLGSKAISVPALSNLSGDVEFDLPFPADTALVNYRVYLNYMCSGASFSEEKQITVRKLTAVPAGVVTRKVRFQGHKNDIYVIANSKIEISFDPTQGGRVLEFIDRKTLTNQVRIDYDLVPSLTSIAYDYAIWFTFNGKLKNSPWEIASAENGTLTLQVKGLDGKFDTSMDWAIKPDDSALNLNVQIKNTSDAATKMKFYMHPEYHLSGKGESGVDIFLFPTEGGIFQVPFWIDLNERQTPVLSENWWGVFDNVSQLEMKQTYSDGWNAPRLWFGGGWYNVEMSREFELAPNEEVKASIVWTLSTHKTDK